MHDARPVSIPQVLTGHDHLAHAWAAKVPGDSLLCWCKVPICMFMEGMVVERFKCGDVLLRLSQSIEQQSAAAVRQSRCS